MQITVLHGQHGEVISAKNSRYSYSSERPCYIRDEKLKRNVYLSQGRVRPDNWNDRKDWPKVSESDMVEVNAFWDALELTRDDE